MRVSKLAFMAFAALVATSGSAYAIDVTKKIAAPGQILVLWSTISEFCSIKDWHPAIAGCKESKEGDATFRVLTLKDNGGTIKEKLTGSDDTSYCRSNCDSGPAVQFPYATTLIPMRLEFGFVKA